PAIKCLALHRSAERRGRAAKDDSGWLLAAGDDGGQVVLWDLERHIPKSYCHGSTHSVYAMTFSPDGATLVTGGRHAVKLWDLASGRLLLNIGRGDFHTGLAVSPDGKQLAVSSQCGFSAHGGVTVWSLEPGRGIQTLHGLI